MFKKLLLLLLPLSGFAQDTITFTQLSNRTADMNGDFIVRDVYANIISTCFKDGQYYTDTVKNQSTHYQAGAITNGLKQGTWKTYKVGVTDTLFAKGVWHNDTLLELINYYSNGNMQVKYTYHKNKIASESYYVADGRKYMEYNYLDCSDRFSDYDQVYMDYHSNGMLRSIGKVRRSPSPQPSSSRYGTWYFYNRKGKVWQTTDYDASAHTRTYRRKGKHYEWYEQQY
ncbi:MAG: hypothetical protein V4658_06120 [Bacteroidota bacterium]